jgi:hypothetical protein
MVKGRFHLHNLDVRAGRDLNQRGADHFVDLIDERWLSTLRAKPNVIERHSVTRSGIHSQRCLEQKHLPLGSS